MSLGENIRELRKLKGFTQTDLAKKLGLQFGTISKYEKNEISIPSDTLSKIADILETSTDYLLGRNEFSKKIDNPIQIAASTKDNIDLSDVDEEDKKTIMNIYNMIKNKNKNN